MVRPIALCIEYLDQRSRADRYMCCVATPGYDVALGLDVHGDVVWRDDVHLAYELWVSADQQLMVVRRAGTPPIEVFRAGRSLSLPFDKPVILIDCDRLTIGSRSVRVHVHGPTEAVQPPEPLATERSGRSVAALAAAVAISASAIGCKPTSEGASPSAVIVEPQPSATMEAPDLDGSVQDVGPEAEAAPAVSGSASALPETLPTGKPPIEVRHRPPKPVRPRDGGLDY